MTAAVIPLPPPVRDLPVSATHRQVVPVLVGPRGRQQHRIDCPLCGKQHFHGVGLGHRVSHCGLTFLDGSYTLTSALDERELELRKLDADARACFARHGYRWPGTWFLGGEAEQDVRVKGGGKTSAAYRWTATLDDEGMPAEVVLTRHAKDKGGAEYVAPFQRIAWRRSGAHEASPSAPAIDLDTYLDLWDRVRFASPLWAQYEALWPQREQAEAFFAAHGKEMDAKTDQQVARILAGLEPEPPSQQNEAPAMQMSDPPQPSKPSATPSAATPTAPKPAKPGERIASFPAVWLSKAQMPEHSQAIVKGLMDPGSFVLIVGPSGSGKTFLTQDIALHVACGMPWRGRSVLRSLVVYVAAEAGTAILRRFIAWREQKLGESVDLVPLAILTRGPDMLNGVDVAVLLRQLKELSAEAGLPVRLVVFDTLSRSIPGGDENASADMTAVISVADQIRDELSAATAFVHHVGKDPTRGARGHSSLYAAADLVLAVGDGVATVEKQRDGVAGERFPFRLEVVELGTDPDGDPITTCLVAHQDAVQAPTRDKAIALSGVAMVALQALHEAVGEYGEAMGGSSTIPAGVRAVKLDDWRTRFRLRYGSDGEGQRDQDAIRQAFKRAREQLLKAGKVGISHPYCWSTGR